MQQISAPELAQWLADSGRDQPILLDVREPWEVQTCQIAGSLAIPMNTIPARQQELDPEASIVCICHHGARSAQVAHFLAQQGFANVINLSGGVHAWSQSVDPGMPTY